MEHTTHTRLKEFGGSDYEMVDGQPDIRGWSVKDSSGNKLGKVKDFLFDTTSLKVRYMIVDLKDNTFDLKNERVLVPIGMAQLDDNDDDVYLPNMGVEQLRTVPEYRYEDLNDQYETSLRNAYHGRTEGTEGYYGSDHVVDETFYDHDTYRDDRFYGKRYRGDDSLSTSSLGRDHDHSGSMPSTNLGGATTPGTSTLGTTYDGGHNTGSTYGNTEGGTGRYATGSGTGLSGTSSSDASTLGSSGTTGSSYTDKDTISNDSGGTGTSVTDSNTGRGYLTGSGIRLRNRNTSGQAGDLTPGESEIR